MSTSIRNPKWWQLYLTLPLLIALFLMDGRLKISTRGHQAVQIAIVLLVYGVIHLWLKANARALSAMDQGQDRGSFRVIEIPPYPLTSTGDDIRPILQLPSSEIRGMLSDAIEMNQIDADVFPVDPVSHELNKEQE